MACFMTQGEKVECGNNNEYENKIDITNLQFQESDVMNLEPMRFGNTFDFILD